MITLARSSRSSVSRLAGGLAALVLLAPSATPLAAQRDDTLLGRRGTDIGGFGGPVVKFSRLAGTDAVFSGGRGGVILNRRVVVGVGGYAVASEHIRTDFRFEDGTRPSLQLGYGGLELEVITQPSRLVHGTFSLLLGGGEAMYSARTESGATVSTRTLASEVFVAEPGAHLELNVTRWFRPGIGIGYRYVNGSDLPGVNDAGLSGAVGTLTFKFGRF
jgi:hypothetical protein